MIISERMKQREERETCEIYENREKNTGKGSSSERKSRAVPLGDEVPLADISGRYVST